MKKLIPTALAACLVSFGALANDPFVEENALGRTDWTEGYIEATGQGTSRYMGSKVQEELMAKQAARTMAQAKLLELVKGIRVTGLTTLGAHAQGDTRAATRVKGTLRGAKAVSENIRWHKDKTARRGEVVMADVTLRLCMTPSCSDTPQSLSDAIRTKPVEKIESPATQTNTESTISAVIIDLQQALYFPALAPEVIDEAGQVIYAETLVGTSGDIVQYAKTVQGAKKLEKAGNSPLVISALKVSKDNQIVVSTDTADKLKDLAALRDGHLIVALD